VSPPLAPYAAREAESRGRLYEEPAPSHRSEFQRDRDRIVHSAAFRRLEYKTQVFVNHQGDMFRTRLTHSIEVAQVARTVARALGLNEDLTEAVALAHDLGHTPFGHAGQDALNHCMKEFGGFEHNHQSLRVVDRLEARYGAFPGLNLSFETREGILKHCSKARARALGPVAARFLARGQPGLEAQVANLADEIAYNHHDMDDGLRAGLIQLEDLQKLAPFAHHYGQVCEQWPDIGQRRKTHETIRHMINHATSDLIETTRTGLAEHRPVSIDEVRSHERPLVSLSPEVSEQQRALKKFLHGNLYHHHRVHRMSVKAKRIVKDLFGAFFADPGLLPRETRDDAGSLQDRAACARTVADYIAGMTDRFAILEHERIFNPAHLT